MRRSRYAEIERAHAHESKELLKQASSEWNLTAGFGREASV